MLSEEGRRRAVPRRTSAGTKAAVNADRLTAGEVGPSFRDHRRPGEGNPGLQEPGVSGLTSQELHLPRYYAVRALQHPWVSHVFSSLRVGLRESKRNLKIEFFSFQIVSDI